MIDPNDPNWEKLIEENKLGEFIGGKVIKSTEFSDLVKITCPECGTVLLKAYFNQDGKVLDMIIQCMTCYEKTGHKIVARVQMHPPKR